MQLAEQDPLIAVRRDDERQELSVSLFGEVQKEVIQATLAAEYGLDVGFRETTTICVERPAGSGDALEVLCAKTKSNVTGKSSPDSSNPFLATLGLRVDRAPAGSGVEVRLDVDVRLLPIYVYKTVEGFAGADGPLRSRRGAGGALRLAGRRLRGHGDRLRLPGPRGSTAADFRELTARVLRQALERAGTVVCEPIVRATLELPADTIGAVLPALARLGAAVEAPSLRGRLATIDAFLPAARTHELQRQLPGLTRGEGVVECVFDRYAPVARAGGRL